ncbi:AAA family ATPase [Cellulomonas carbonis]|uniref:Chromosome partitioning protein n=1 Tax=Cellulomonas carbonis T26 TaxID=947969 RepID=A0A0A0BRN9_9CELL|nr:ParA family protein [Cellulomonas carbonis]KGM09759.1 hypothetical protein N868_18765 [Cellulomonas carbonis T26]KGM09772.1 hypothetical protein N868_18830 [Cellulomonas carbonis T26]GGC11685.1 pilus biosynthesis protein CpaE [Cellulomonas carbonis]
MSTGVLCAVRGAAEATAVQLLGESSRLEVTRRCADLAELLASAAAGAGAVAVVTAGVPGLDREAVHHLHGSGVWVVLLVDGVAPWEALPAELGADAVLDVRHVDELPAVVTALLDEAGRTGARPGSPTRPATAVDPAARLEGPAPDAAPGGGRRPAEGTLVAVWGPTGAPGRTTLAVNLAAELAATSAEPAGGSALLVDADTYGGTVAPVLGLLDEAPGLAAAARAAASGRLDVAVLATLSPVLDGGLRVLSGISRADRWPEVAPASLDVLWSVARELVRWTVVDCGFCLEEDELLAYDTRAPRRNGATLSAVEAADVLVVVGAGDPIGMQRLVRGLGELRDRLPAVEPVVVVNRVRASASGPQPGDAIRDALHRYAGVADVRLVPDDGPACDAALLAGRTLVEHVPTSPARRAVSRLAEEVVARRALVTAH